jgi:PAS domain S-box-containing protein
MRPIDYGIDFYADSLFTTEQELRRHPRRVAAFRRASLKGWEYAMRHPEELIALILKLPGVRERGVTEDLLRYEAAQMEPLIQPTLMEIGHMNRGRWQRMADTYAELGLLRPGLSMEGFLYDSAPLPKVRRMLYLLSGRLVGVLLVGALAVAWNGQLRRSVRTRTAELRASRAYLKSVLDASNDAVFVHDADTFQVIDVNRRACEMYGFTREQALLSTPRELSQGDPPYGPNEALAWLRKARADGPQVFTWWARRVDGHLFWTEVGIRFTLIGGASRFVVTIRDISGRKETEEALLRSTQSYEDIYHSVSEAIYIHDEKGVFIDVNRGAEAMYGYTRTELIGKTPADVAAPGRNDLAAIGRIIRKTFADGTPGQFEFWAVRRSGEVFPKDVIVNKGRYFGQDVLITTARDISAMKRAEQERERLQAQLTQAHKMESVGRLAGGVAHDFNNMLGVILGRTEMAMEKLDPELPLFEDLQEIQKAARRSADLTRQLLAYARKQPATPRVLQLNETVEGMLKMLRRLIGEDTELAWLPGAAPWPILVDPVQIDQVLANLCVNARDAIRGVGQVKIETGNASLDPSFCASRDGAEPGDFVWLSVSDNGCGMDGEVMAHLFEPFFTTKEVGLGTGLGLAMVYGIVKQNNGFIEARSTPGQGSSFKVYLPRHHGPTVPLPEGAPAHPATSGHQTILLVEDEPAVLEMCRSILARAGYRILPAATPDEALRLADAHAGEIDLLLTDVVMPGMNGWDLAQRLCARYPTLRKLFMSGYTADVITSRGVEQEGVPFIQKPFSNGDLAAKVRAVLKEPR